MYVFGFSGGENRMARRRRENLGMPGELTRANSSDELGRKRPVSDGATLPALKRRGR